MQRELPPGLNNLREALRDKAKLVVCDVGMLAVGMPLATLGKFMNLYGYFPEAPEEIRGHLSNASDVVAYAPLINFVMISVTGRSDPITSGLAVLGAGLLRKYYQYCGNAYGPHSAYHFDDASFLVLSTSLYIGGHLLCNRLFQRSPEEPTTKHSSLGRLRARFDKIM